MILVFSIGENLKVITRSTKKHPNLKIIEYHCLNCKNTQRINLLRNKIKKEIKIQESKPNSNRRKLLLNLFS